MSSKKILVTGADGFIGSHLVELFVALGFQVVAFDKYNSYSNLSWLDKSNYKNDMEILLGDVRDYDSISKAMKGCDAVFHLAALIGIPYSYNSPLAYVRTNVEGTYNVLESAKNLDLEEILITSTSETYGTAKYVPIDEKHPSKSQSPYAASKIGADHLALSYYYSFKLPVKIVRPFNVYGPRQSARAVIPTIIIQALSESKKVALGNLSPTRDLTYVKDTCSAFYEIYKNKKFIGEVINVGSNNEISIKDLAEKILTLTKKQSGNLIKDLNRVRPEDSEVMQLKCNNNKLIQNTNWKPKYSLENGLIETVDWFKKNMKIFDSKKYYV